MSMSLDFCIATASNPLRSGYSDRNWNKAKEVESKPFFDAILNGERNLVVTGKDESGENIHLNVSLSFAKDTNFDYFASDSHIHDGTLVFTKSLIYNLVKRVCCCSTYNKKLREPKAGDKVKYIIGNFVILNEYDGDFVPNDRPYMRERTTVLLPLKFEIKD